MNIKERKKLQHELLGIISNIIIESENSTIEAMETRSVEIIKKLKEHINDDVEHFNDRKTILDWVITCDSRGGNRLNNKSLLKFEKAIKDVRGITGDERRVLWNFFTNMDENTQRLIIQELINNIKDMEENIRTPSKEELLSHIRDIYIRTHGELVLSPPRNRNENIRRSSEQIRPNYVRNREVNTSKIFQLVLVASCITVGAVIGATVGMLLTLSCAYLGVITNAGLLFPIMAATAIVGAIIAGAAPMLELVKMFRDLPSGGLESSNTEYISSRQEVF